MIAVIGFGSLIWDLDNLSPHVRGGWKMYAGPRLPVEFSLVSKKRLGALALVIDHRDGSECPTCVIESRRPDLQSAAQDLALRERTDIQNIGLFDRNSGLARGAEQGTLDSVARWIESTPYDSAVWTDGKSNFAEHTGAEFDLDAAQRHLASLNAMSRREAQRYIQNAPLRVDTALRRAVSQSSWWQTR